MHESSNSPNRDHLDDRVRELYQDLRNIASSRIRRESDHRILQTTALLHETYLKMARQHQKAWDSESSFLAAASGTMRRVLIDLARIRKADKRGGGQSVASTDQLQVPCLDGCFDVLDINDSLERLQEFAPEESQIMEMLVFSEMTMEQIAESLDLSLSTVQRRIRSARAWLARELSREHS